MEWCFIKYLNLLLLFISIDIFACRDPSSQRSKSDILDEAMDKSQVVVIATVKNICLEKECGKGKLTINVNKFFKGDTERTIDVLPGWSSCGRKERFHPAKSIMVNGKSRTTLNYLVGEKYLLVINKFPYRDGYGLKVGEIVGANTLPYIIKYTEHNTANKSLKQDK